MENNKTFQITVVGNDPYEHLVRVIEGNDSDITEYTKELINKVAEYNGNTKVVKSDSELFIQNNDLTPKVLESLCSDFSLESVTVGSKVEVNHKHLFKLRKEFKRFKSLSELQSYLTVIAEQQLFTYTNVFIDDTAEEPLAVIQYLDTPVTVPVKRLGVRNVWSYTINTEINCVNVTHFDIDSDCNGELMKWLSEVEELEAKLEPSEVTQGLDEGDNEDLIHDLLLETDKLYHFEVDNEHALRVFEHSVLHHRLPFVIYEDISNGYNYVYISEDVDAINLIKRLDSQNVIQAVGSESVYIEDSSNLKHTGVALNLPTVDQNGNTIPDVIHRRILTAIVSKG